ncbi:MAG: hypothetical protein C4541_07010 [Candidatus Auribacter fodinae]|uniref:Uncharacterized protein n=1 Tax=Candidatus Auribacter fodinae TaxID=2093366 RepID=A0A3A4QYM3_9BACT|nr:MAG: hypothetical protein C4541_07010 [Candidatus Auribacter fodinae]
MKRMLLMFMIVMVSCTVCHADSDERYAIVTDKDNIQSEVRGLQSSSQYNDRWENIYDPFICMYDSSLCIAVPIKHIISLRLENGKYLMEYIYGGNNLKFSGLLDEYVKFSGETDFGDFSLPGNTLLSITFSSPPVEEPQAEQAEYPHVIELENETRIPVRIESRTDHFYDTTGYIMGGETYTHHYTDFRFKRGQAELTVPFEDIASLEFTFEGPYVAPGEVVVTLKNGKTTTGQLYAADTMEFGGLSGVCEKGYFYIHGRNIKKVFFVADQQ